MSTILILTLLLLLLLLHLPCTLGTSIPSSSGDISGDLRRRRHWRVLHQPFFPADVPPQAPPPSTFAALPPQPQQPKLPSSNVPSSGSGSGSGSGRRPFFPSDSPPKSPPPPSPRGTTAAAFPNVVNTFPANISSLTLPQSPSRKPFSPKLVVIAAAVLSISVASVLVLFLYHRRHRDFAAAAAATCKPPGSDSLRLYPADAATSDGVGGGGGCGSKSVGGSGANSTEFPFPGGGVGDLGGSVVGIAAVQSVSVHQKMGSPELRPLPPLPRLNLWREKPKTDPWNDREGDEEDDFFSPRGSLGGKGSNSSSSPNPNPHPHPERAIGSAAVAGNFGSRSSNSYPDLISASPSPPERASPERVSSGSPVLTKLPPPTIVETPFVAPAESWDSISVVPPPPLPPPKPIAPKPASSVEGSEDATKPKLKPLHWDKVRASSECAMVWDHLESSSFQLNEEMIETLFVVNGSNLNRKEIHRWPGMPPASTDQENQVLDPKKSQNIAILLRALNVTIEEVCEALLQGHTDTLGAELLESLLRMAPTKEEECKLKEYNDQSPFKLGPAERFLKAVIHIPFAFKRVDAMLYIANFDSDVEYLKRSFETLEAACEELRNSRMFLKLLEAVLKTGNRMNVGTNRGDALAFKLDTLLKLVDVKGTDGKTTLLHFVVHEISRAEGSRLSSANYNQNHNRTPESDLRDDIEFRKLGLQVVSSLSGELSSVKKAATMDFDVLSSDVAKLARGVTKIRKVAKLDEELALRESSWCFSESMNGFLKKAEEEITRMQAQETITLSMVKEITEYFHGNSAKEEAHRCRIFLVVRDFLLILDNVCKDVGKMNERTIVSSGRQIPQLINPAMLSDFHGLDGRQQCGSPDDQNSPSS